MSRILILVVVVFGTCLSQELSTQLIQLFTQNTSLVTRSPDKTSSTTSTTQPTTKHVSTENSARKNKTYNNATTKVPNYCGTNSNNTDCLSVPLTTASTILNNKTNITELPKKVEKKSKIIKKSYGNSKEVCSCDLQLNICDINCCCDEDCSSENKKIFRYCQTDENWYYDTRYCDYMKYIYINNTPVEWQVNQNGLFCIVKSNLPLSSVVQRKTPIRSYNEVVSEKQLKPFSWTTKTTFKETFNSSETLVYGSRVWTVHQNGEIQKFHLPKSFLTSLCVFEEDVLFLKNMDSKCSQIDLSEDNRRLNFGNYFQNYKIISAPNMLNISKFKNIYMECPKNVCLEVESKICQTHFKNCSKLISARNNNFTCHFDLLNKQNICKNAVRHIRYIFYHDGIKGIKKVEVLGILQNFSFEVSRTPFEIQQEFQVNFVWLNQTSNVSQIWSGNPGYIIGKPVIKGYKIINNDTKLILRDSNNPIDVFLAFFQNYQSKCWFNETAHTLVEFGYNSFYQCDFVEDFIYNNLTISANQICRDLQRKIFEFFGVQKNKTAVIGSFGNADSKTAQDWFDVIFNVNPEEFLQNYTRGIYTNDNKTINCFNISTASSVDVFHSRIDFDHLINQEKLLGVSYSFDKPKNFRFSLHKESKNLTLLSAKFKLQQSVIFHDLTTEKWRKFVDPPSLEIKLPYDFFYPFVKVANGNGNVCTLQFLVSLSCFVLNLI